MVTAAPMGGEMPRKNDTRYKNVGSRYRASMRYSVIMSRLSNTHTKKNRRYAGVKLLVSREDFINWFMPRDFDGCSVDRIDPKGHYELSNMQVIPLAENIAKDKRKAKDNLCECYICKSVKPLTEFVKESRRGNGYSTICIECERERSLRRKEKRMKEKEAGK